MNKLAGAIICGIALWGVAASGGAQAAPPDKCQAAIHKVASIWPDVVKKVDKRTAGEATKAAAEAHSALKAGMELLVALAKVARATGDEDDLAVAQVVDDAVTELKVVAPTTAAIAAWGKANEVCGQVKLLTKEDANVACERPSLVGKVKAACGACDAATATMQALAAGTPAGEHTIVELIEAATEHANLALDGLAEGGVASHPRGRTLAAAVAKHLAAVKVGLAAALESSNAGGTAWDVYDAINAQEGRADWATKAGELPTLMGVAVHLKAVETACSNDGGAGARTHGTAQGGDARRDQQILSAGGVDWSNADLVIDPVKGYVRLRNGKSGPLCATGPDGEGCCSQKCVQERAEGDDAVGEVELVGVLVGDLTDEFPGDEYVLQLEGNASGGNYSGSIFLAYRVVGGRPLPLAQLDFNKYAGRETGGVAPRVAAGGLDVSGVEYRVDDAGCCPSLGFTATYRLVKQKKGFVFKPDKEKTWQLSAEGEPPAQPHNEQGADGDEPDTPAPAPASKRVVVGVLRMGLIDVQGFCSKSGIQSNVRQRAGAFRACYEQRLKEKPSLAGKITMAWTINLAGQAERVTVTASTLQDESVENCVLATARRMQFLKPEGGTCAVQVPLVFEAK